jgi:hypothetical protein
VGSVSFGWVKGRLVSPEWSVARTKARRMGYLPSERTGP